ncbi:hypothetical protein PYW07_009640 [Mythimna separata]|uniref:HAT C-terminal dimerisation domain-containing protein n=1 Tax=Mythimna separata TaxID=271217 RepID=A0AAD7YCD1_MYTSE|nr:hypothetical protein PYW07_009640 [Mythimna separata]
MNYIKRSIEENREPEDCPLSITSAADDVDNDDIWETHNKLLLETMRTNRSHIQTSELSLYIAAPLIGLKEDALESWKSYEGAYPKLTNLALKQAIVMTLDVKRNDLLLTDNDCLEFVRAENALTKRRINALPVEVQRELIGRKRQNELQRVLLPDAPPRKKQTRRPSPEREACPLVEVPEVAVGESAPEPAPEVVQQAPEVEQQAPEVELEPEPQPLEVHYNDMEFDQEVAKLTPTNPTAAGIVEIEKYLQEPLLKRTSHPFLWWEEGRQIYPLLFTCRKD